MMSKIATNFEEEESKTQNFRAARALSDISDESVFCNDKNRREAAKFFLGVKIAAKRRNFFRAKIAAKRRFFCC